MWITQKCPQTASHEVSPCSVSHSSLRSGVPCALRLMCSAAQSQCLMTLSSLIRNTGIILIHPFGGPTMANWYRLGGGWTIRTWRSRVKHRIIGRRSGLHRVGFGRIDTLQRAPHLCAYQHFGVDPLRMVHRACR